MNSRGVRTVACAAGLAVLTTVGLVCAGTIPRTVNVAAPQATNAVGLTLSWQPVAEDIHGQAKAVSGYNVYCSSDPRFVPDTDTHTNLLVSTNVASFVHSNALATSTSLFYYVTAVGADDTESLVFTDMVYKVSSSIDCPPGSNVFAWLSLPYECQWTNAASLAGQLPDVDKLYSFNDTNQSYAMWDCGASTGSNFRVAAGDALGVEVSTGTVLHVYGKHSWTNAFVWEHRTDRFNHHWISLPPNAAYSNASALAEAVSACSKVARFDTATGAYESWFLLAGEWRGTDFAIPPNDGVLVSVSGNSTWTPALIYPIATLTLETGAGYIDTMALNATAQVASATGPLAEYAWDYDGDGVFDASGASPVLTYSHSFTNPATWFPTIRVKDERGFYALDSARYDALSMSLSFSNQAFQAGLNETGQVCFTASTGGVFSVYVYDSQSNLVSVLESNVVHASGSACLSWDGRDTEGALASNGVYYVVVEQTIGSETITYDPAFLMRGSNITAEITGIYVASSFDPYSGGQFPIRYDLSAPARVTVTIEDDLGLTIGLVCSNALRSAGTHTEYWDGRLLSGAMISAGQTFNVAIDAVSVGNNVLLVDEPLPSIDNLAASATEFIPALNPYGTGTNSLSLSYDLQAAADLRIEVRAESGNLIRNALEPGMPAGGNQSVWPGTDDAGRLAAAGLYSVTLSSEFGSRHGQPSTVWVEVYY